MSNDGSQQLGRRQSNSDRQHLSRRGYLAAGAALGSAAIAGCLGGDGDETLTVGMAVPTTGVYALLGESITNGFELFLEENDGEINGQEVEIVSRDTEADTSRGVSITRELITSEGADAIVGPVSSAVAIAMMETIESEGSAVWLNANAGDYRVTRDGCMRYHFRTSFNDWQTSAPLAQWVYDNIGETVCIANADYAFGNNSREFFREAFEEVGGEVVEEVGVPLGTDDFSPYFDDIESSGADAIYSFFAGSDAVNYISQGDDFGLFDEMVQTGSGFLLSEDTLPAQGSAAVGKYSLLHYASTAEQTQDFVAAYRDAYDETANVYAAQGYDSAQAFAAAIEDGGSSDIDDIIDAMRGMEIDSPRGNFRFNEDTNDPIQDMHVREVVDGDDGPENQVVETIENVESPTWDCSIY